jgi:hypothetical protein
MDVVRTHDRRDGHHAGLRSQPSRGQIPSRSSTLPAAAHCAISIATPVRPRRYGVPRPLCLLKRTWRLRCARRLGASSRTCRLVRANEGGDRSLRPLQQQGREFIGHVEHHIMPACKLLLPPAALSCLGVKLAERTFKATRPNVSDVCDAVAGAADLRRRVNRLANLTPDRRPILTPLNGGFWR